MKSSGKNVYGPLEKEKEKAPDKKEAGKVPKSPEEWLGPEPHQERPIAVANQYVSSVLNEFHEGRC